MYTIDSIIRLYKDPFGVENTTPQESKDFSKESMTSLVVQMWHDQMWHDQMWYDQMWQDQTFPQTNDFIFIYSIN